MKKNFTAALAACLLGGLLMGPAAADSTAPGATLAMGPDRAPRAPRKAVTAPVQRAESVRREETVVAPPAQVRDTFVYKKTECHSQTNVTYDIWGQHHRVTNAAAVYSFDNGQVHAWSPTDAFLVNKLGTMEADREFLNLKACERLGVWANGGIAGSTPASIVADIVSKFKGVTCGSWTAPADYNVAGIPVTRATGVDVFGQYFYEVYALERFGNTYAFATRVPYRAMYNVKRNTDLAFLITHIHPAVWVEE